MKMQTVIQQDSLQLNGIPVAPRPSVADFRALLGPESRREIQTGVSRGVAYHWYWDDSGLAVVGDTETELSFAFLQLDGTEPHATWAPRANYSGDLVVFGIRHLDGETADTFHDRILASTEPHWVSSDRNNVALRDSFSPGPSVHISREPRGGSADKKPYWYISYNFANGSAETRHNSKLMACPACGKTVARSARNCEACGADIPAELADAGSRDWRYIQCPRGHVMHRFAACCIVDGSPNTWYRNQVIFSTLACVGSVVLLFSFGSSAAVILFGALAWRIGLAIGKWYYRPSE